MSLILDALRKIEEERRYGEQKVGDSAPRPGAPDLSRHRLGLRAGTMAAIALASAALTAGVLRVLSPEPETEATAPQRAVVEEAAAPVEPSAEASRESERPVAEPLLYAPDPPPRKSLVETPPTQADGTSVVESPAPEVASALEPEAEPPGVFRLVGQGSPNRTAAIVDPEPSSAEMDPGLPQLVLQGTSVIDGKPVAVISDQRVFEGDHIHGAVVIRIQERAVELEFEGRRFTLTL